MLAASAAVGISAGGAGGLGRRHAGLASVPIWGGRRTSRSRTAAAATGASGTLPAHPSWDMFANVQSEVSRVQAAVASNTTALQFTNEKIDKLDSRVDEGFAKLADAMDKQAAMQAEAMAKQAAMQAEAMAKQAAMQAEAMAKQADAITKLQRSIDQLPLAALKPHRAVSWGASVVAIRLKKGGSRTARVMRMQPCLAVTIGGLGAVTAYVQQLLDVTQSSATQECRDQAGGHQAVHNFMLHRLGEQGGLRFRHHYHRWRGALAIYRAMYPYLGRGFFYNGSNATGNSVLAHMRLCQFCRKQQDAGAATTA
ncbi:hypothetical protein CHLNCDRAFT_137120 [Chlorella variabilis]|uniref:Uncharacterized protein n=1 Tax=Chlorella variabilis TaxID=554065 RepID=E1ZLA0_CHLVA|nr:hypothetical protein CHLNCDRAFT_137120 [Chlorella variabilis]EFN53365.1 hypothetical protein CHLNCDRAFT_137120 [Chlorella variabilis]|eukprot:XP_005845467.1 hypothetical protein CHLNCDRAFT_137120 [Chlorella variabilis]